LPLAGLLKIVALILIMLPAIMCAYALAADQARAVFRSPW
jgi:hypothetical protein